MILGKRGSIVKVVKSLLLFGESIQAILERAYLGVFGMILYLKTKAILSLSPRNKSEIKND